MTRSTDELTRLLVGAAGDIVERERVPGPDAPSLWRRGRRTTWLARGAAAGLAAALVLVGGALVAVVRDRPATMPSDGTSLTYPRLVSDLFTEGDAAEPGPVFGLVALPPLDHRGSHTGVIDRSGVLSGLPRWSGSTTTIDLDSLEDPGGALAPDGVHLLIRDGIVDLTDGSLTRPLMVEGVSQVALDGRAVWSPDSRHIAVGTLQGPLVLDSFADVVTQRRRAPGDTNVLLAGWLDNATVVGVRTPSGPPLGAPAPGTPGTPETAGAATAALDIVARGLGEADWSTLSVVSPDAVKAAGTGGLASLTAAYASPDGSRLLLVGRDGHSALVDTVTGQPVAFAGAESASGPAPTSVTWDACDPVWQDDQPLLADGGLHRPGDRRAVLAFADRVQAGCVTLAGNELTGTPAPGRASSEQVWRIALPVFWALALVAALALTVWTVVALRRSRRHGEDFLPMLLGRLF